MQSNWHLLDFIEDQTYFLLYFVTGYYLNIAILNVGTGKSKDITQPYYRRK